MNDIFLTKDADALICVVYKHYLQRRKRGDLKQDAREMGDSHTIQEIFLPEWQLGDVEEACRELSRAGLLHCVFGDDELCFSALSDRGIVYMEQRFRAGLSAVLDYIEKFASLIP